MNRKSPPWIACLVVSLAWQGCKPATPEWELANPVVALPEPPLGVDHAFSELQEPPTPERVRLGRWLYYDTRLSADNTIACATCHKPENAFSEPTPVSTGIGGQKGTARRRPSSTPPGPSSPARSGTAARPRSRSRRWGRSRIPSRWATTTKR